jgi:cold-inducible RNA-binding protein
MANAKLFVGSLSYDTTEERLREIFAEFGNVVSATIIMDRATNRSKGFGFVEFESAEDAQKAVAELNGKEVDGRKLTVNEARPQVER